MRVSDSTVTVELTGGLANQLFQWAAGYQLASEFGVHLALDARIVERPGSRGLQIEKMVPASTVLRLSEKEREFWTRLSRARPRKVAAIARRIRGGTLGRGATVARNYEEARNKLSVLRPNVRLSGFFQEVEQLEGAKEAISSCIKLPELPSGVPERFSAVHVRRGDYVSNPKYARIYGSCSFSYYVAGIERLSRDHPVIVATDDRDWARALIAEVGRPDVSISPGANHFDDFALLASAEEIVLSNSTFSWWAAFLRRPSTVVAPEPWFSDRAREKGLIRPGWLVMPRDSTASSNAPTI